MLFNYLITAWRNLARHRSYTAINVVGLGLAIGCNLLVQQYVTHELTYDSFHERGERIYRIDVVRDGRRSPQITPDWGPGLAARYTGFANVVRTKGMPEHLMRGDVITEQEMLFADPSILEVFNFPLVSGTLATVLQDNHSVALTSGAALSHFGTTDVIGKELTVAVENWKPVGDYGFERPQFDEFDFTVSGVLEDVPSNSSIQFDVLLSYSAADRLDVSGFPHVFVELEKGVLAADLQAQFPSFVKTEIGVDPESWQLVLMPFGDIHFDGMSTMRLGRGGRHTYLWVFSGIALFVLVLACINYTNLGIARTATRAREIGIRKAIGARRAQLLFQFCGEAILLSVISVAIGLGLAEIARPLFNQLVDFDLPFDYGSTRLIGGILAVTLVTGLIAGGVPAAVLSNVRAVAVLASRHGGSSKSMFNRVLMTFQFGLSVFLVVVTAVMVKQVDFMKQKDLGFDGDQIVCAGHHGVPPQTYDLFRNKLLTHRQVSNVTFAYPAPGGRSRAWAKWKPPGQQRELAVARYWVDSHFVATLGLEIVAGSDFDEGHAAGGAVLINEAMAEALGAVDPVGLPLVGLAKEGELDPVVLGVVNDFHNSRVHHRIGPAVMYPRRDEHGYMLVRLDKNGIADGLQVIEEAWNEIATDVPYRYQFYDEWYDQFYREEERWIQAIGYAAVLAVFISCLGLYGLAAITASRRTKEIGVRKVLGATTAGIAALVSREFVLLAGAANFVAWPVAYLVMSRWLENFAYYTDLAPWIFASAGLAAVGVALLTVSTQAMKAAVTNPVDVLRYE